MAIPETSFGLALSAEAVAWTANLRAELAAASGETIAPHLIVMRTVRQAIEQLAAPSDIMPSVSRQPFGQTSRRGAEAVRRTSIDRLALRDLGKIEAYSEQGPGTVNLYGSLTLAVQSLHKLPARQPVPKPLRRAATWLNPVEQSGTLMYDLQAGGLRTLTDCNKESVLTGDVTLRDIDHAAAHPSDGAPAFAGLLQWLEIAGTLQPNIIPQR